MTSIINNNCLLLLDSVFVIFRIMKVSVKVVDNLYFDLDYSGYHKNLI